jgi:hypothetical protein
VAESIDLLVDRAVLFDVGVGSRNVRLRLVVVVDLTKNSTRLSGSISFSSAANWAARDCWVRESMLDAGRIQSSTQSLRSYPIRILRVSGSEDHHEALDSGPR